MKREEIIINSVQQWLGNPVAKAMLKYICGRSSRGWSRLEIALRRYTGEEIPCDLRDRIASFIVKLMVGRGSFLFGYPEESLRDHLRDPVIRRGIANVLEGIAKHGVHCPFVPVAPFLVVWNYTRACNLNCKHCYGNTTRRQAPDELTIEEAKRAIDQFEETGVVALAFSGGEPLMRKDIFEVAGYARSRGFFVSVATNGVLITKRVAGRMKQVFDYAEISLDGFEEVHDRFRGVRGAWKSTCEGIKNCVEAGIDTCLALTATKYNLREIPKLIDFAEELGMKRVIIFNYVPVGRGKGMVEQDLSPEERWKLLEFMYGRMMETGCSLICYSTAPQFSVVSLQFTENGEKGMVSTHFTSEEMMQALRGRTQSLASFLGGCGAGRLYCGLEPNGDITPCVFMPIKIGNIRRDNLREVWESSEVLWKLRDRDALEGCGACEYRYVCGGCRARAHGYYGDVRAPDPGCVYNQNYWDALKQNFEKRG
jgi:radical SAM protein with 4Fe4S-binding SPASM domain